LNWAANEITTTDNYGTSNTVGFYLLDDSNSVVTSATLQFKIIDIPSLYVDHTGAHLVVKWAGGDFTLENSTAMGPAASWSAVSGATDSPATIPLGGGHAGFYRLHK
jgi:hypothetical protein